MYNYYNQNQNNLYSSSVIGIRDEDDKVIGTGCFVSPKYILTCEHVIKGALGNNYRLKYNQGKEITFKFMNDDEEQKATAIVKYEKPPIQTSDGSIRSGWDIALLEIPQSTISDKFKDRKFPEQKLSIHLSSYLTKDDSVEVRGYPTESGEGVEGRLGVPLNSGWTTIKRINSDRQTTIHIRLENNTITNSNSDWIREGYSGSPVWHNDKKKIIGIVSLQYESNNQESDLAYFIPNDVIHKTIKDDLKNVDEDTKKFLRKALKEIFTDKDPPSHKYEDELSREIKTEFNNIIEAFEIGNIITFIGSGINLLSDGSFSQITLLDELIAIFQGEKETSLSEKDKVLAELIGIPCPICPLHSSDKEFSRDCPLPIYNNEKESQLRASQEKLALSKLHFRFLSGYKQAAILYPKIRKGLEKKTEKVDDTTKKLYQFLANFPKQMIKKSKLPYSLIFTTNYDNFLEREFNERKQPYDLMYYVVNDENECDHDICELGQLRPLGAFKYRIFKQFSDSTIRVEHENEKDLLEPKVIERINQILKGDAKDKIDDYHLLPPVIIIKLFGIFERNFVMTEEHFFDYWIAFQKSDYQLFTILKPFLKGKQILFLGCSLNDSDLVRFWKTVRTKLYLRDQTLNQSWIINDFKPDYMIKSKWEKQGLKSLKSSLQYFTNHLEKNINGGQHG